MTHVDLELQRLERDAQRTANRDGAPVSIFNLNRAGRRMLVIRSADSFPGEDRLVSGPFEPKPRWQTEFPEFPAEAIPALGDDWTDSSWCNDACPSFLHEESGVLLWCDWPDASKRDYPEFVGAGYLFVQMVRDELHGWQHNPADDAPPPLLRTDSLGDVRDVLDHMADGATMAEALQGARLRLNQLTAEDARALIAENDSAPRPCPDLHAHCMAIIAAAEAAPVDLWEGEDEPEPEPCPIHRQPVDRCPASCEFHA